MIGASRRAIALAVMVLVGAGIGYGLSTLLPRWMGGPDANGPVPLLIGGPFSLIDQDGRARSDDEFRGRLMLVFFGYTFCPDVCPLTLQQMADAVESLGRDARAVQPIFITVDPQRDTPDVIKDYVGHFSDSIVGLTGSAEAIAQAARAYRVLYRTSADPAKDPNYLVEHSALIFLMGRDGRYLTHFNHDTPPGPMAEAIRRHL